MSIPPNNPPPNNPPYGNPPPGGYYPAAPPPRKSGGSGWKIAGFGCLGVFLLLAIGGIVLVRNVKNNLAHPQKGSIVGMAVLAGQASLDGVKIQQAIAAYHTQHGAYPKSLMDLVADGSLDGKLLHNGLDEHDDPAHLSWQYTPPAEGAPGSTPILSEDYSVTVGSSSSPGKIVIDLDGKAQSGQNRTRPGAESGSGSGTP